MSNQKIFLRIPKEKQELIFELAKDKKFIHQKYIWKKKFATSLRNSHSPSGRLSKTNLYIRWKQLDKFAGKPNYSKIAKVVGTDGITVKTYLNNLHSKLLKKFRDKENSRDKWFENLSEKEKVEVMNEFCNKLLYEDGNWVGMRYQLKSRCEKCNKWFHIITSHRYSSKQYDIGERKLCSRCLMSEIRKVYLDKKLGRKNEKIQKNR